MFAVLEQIERNIQQQPLPPSPATPAAPTTPQHDSLGYAIPCRSSATRNAEPVATSAQEHAYAVVDVTQKRLSHGKNKTTRNEGNKSLASAHSLQSDESVKPNRINTLVTMAAVAETNDKGTIDPYATVDIIAMRDARQKQMAFQDRETTRENTKLPHTKMEEHDSTGEISSVHEPVDPMYAEVAKTGTIATSYLLTTKDDTIEPYATVDIPYKHKITKRHKVTCDTSTPIDVALSKLETDKSSMCNKATVLTA